MLLNSLPTGRKIGVIEAPLLRTTDRYYISQAAMALALLPVYLLATGWLGYRVLVLLALSCVIGFFVEYFSSRITHRSIGYYGAGTWLVFPLLVPPGLPLWMILLNLALSIVIVQTLFGGFGRQIVNPAVFGQVILMLNYPLRFNSSFLTPFRNPLIGLFNYTSTVLTDTTELGLFAIGMRPSLVKLLSGPNVGFIGEMFPALLIVTGVLYLLIADTNLRTPVSFVLSIAVFSFVGNTFFPQSILPPIPAVFGGSTLVYALFIFSDHWSSTRTKAGRTIAGVVAAVITIVIRSFSPITEGIMYAAIFNYAFGGLFDEIAFSLMKKTGRIPS